MGDGKDLAQSRWVFFGFTWRCWVLLLWFAAFSSSRGVAAVVPVDHCVSDDGSSGRYFHSVSLSCRLCSEFLPRSVASTSTVDQSKTCKKPARNPQEYGRKGCECPPGHILEVENDAPACLACGNGTAPSRDLSRCVPCGKKMRYSEALVECVCEEDNSVIVEKDANGTYLEEKTCVQCADPLRNFPGPHQGRVYECVPCPDPKMIYEPDSPELPFRCVCDSEHRRAGDVCIKREAYEEVDSNFPVAAATEIVFRNIIEPLDGTKNSQTASDSGDRLRGSQEIISSETFKFLYMRCAIGCQQSRDPKSCQCLANLCVLSLYDDRGTVCRVVKDLYLSSPKPAAGHDPLHYSEFPWIFYGEKSSDVLHDSSLSWRFSLDPASPAHRLKLWLAQYALEGQWLGWLPLGSELQLCATRKGAASDPDWTRFGSAVVEECMVQLQDLIACGEEPIFYELFIEDKDGQVVGVPVRIANLVAFDSTPNDNADTSDDVLVRRFFMCDAAAGRTGRESHALKERPQIFRWASEVQVKILVKPSGADGGSGSAIDVPVLSLRYASVRSDSFIAGSRVFGKVEFRAGYWMDSSSFWSAMIGVIIVASVLVVATFLFRLWQFFRRNPPDVEIGQHSFATPLPFLSMLRAFFSIVTTI